MLTVYTTDSCVYCPMVKKFLNAKNINYKEVDVTNDGQARQELFEKTRMMTVPVTTDGEKVVVGYNPANLSQFAT